jgi:hypothetical protein
MIGAAALMALSACAPTPADSLGGPPEADRVEICQAQAFQFLVGRPRADIPAVLPTPSRVVADNQPVTMDYNPSRLNIVWNHETGRVEHVRCG